MQGRTKYHNCSATMKSTSKTVYDMNKIKYGATEFIEIIHALSQVTSTYQDMISKFHFSITFNTHNSNLNINTNLSNNN